MSTTNDFEEAMKKFKQARNIKFDGPGVNGKMLAIIVAAVILAWGFFSSWKTIQPDQEAVVLRLGKYMGTYPPGLQFKMPFGIDKMIVVQTKKVHQIEFGYRTKSMNTYGRTRFDKRFQDESLMLSGDLNVANINWAVQYKISDPFKYLYKINNPDRQKVRTLRDVSESIMRRVVGDRPVDDVLTNKKGEIVSDVKELMQKVLDDYESGIKIVDVLLQGVNPPDSVRESFSDVEAAKQEMATMINEAEKRYNKVIPEARGKAQELVSRSEGRAKEMIAYAQGDAQRFIAVLNAYKKAPLVTKKRIYLETMEELYGKFGKLTIVDSKVKGLLPIFNQQASTK